MHPIKRILSWRGWAFPLGFTIYLFILSNVYGFVENPDIHSFLILGFAIGMIVLLLAILVGLTLCFWMLQDMWKKSDANKNSKSHKHDYSNYGENHHEITDENIIPPMRYYDLLSASPQSSMDEIIRQSRKLILQHHPDRNSSQNTNDKTREIIEARDAIINYLKNSETDYYRNAMSR